MSVPVSLRGGPFTPTILIKKRHLFFYIILIWVSFFVGLLEFWLYWQILYTEGILFWIFLPILGLILYFSAIFSSLIFAKLFLLIANLIHPPKEGLFLRHPTDKDYRYWTIRNTIKRWPIWLSHNFPFPFLDNVCLKVFGVKTKFSNSLFEGWVDTEFIEFGDNVVVGQASIVQSAVIMGNFFIIRKTVIEDNVRIGAHSVVMPGTHIGKNCILGSECFTTVEQELEDGWIYLGTPAKKYKKNDFMEDDLEDELIDAQNVDIKELRMKYEENFFERHDKHLSLREKLEQRLDKREEERQRMEKEY